MPDIPDPHVDAQPPLFDLGDVPRLVDSDLASRLAALHEVPRREIEAVADLYFERSRRRLAEGA